MLVKLQEVIYYTFSDDRGYRGVVAFEHLSDHIGEPWGEGSLVELCRKRDDQILVAGVRIELTLNVNVSDMHALAIKVAYPAETEPFRCMLF